MVGNWIVGLIITCENLFFFSPLSHDSHDRRRCLASDSFPQTASLVLAFNPRQSIYFELPCYRVTQPLSHLDALGGLWTPWADKKICNFNFATATSIRTMQLQLRHCNFKLRHCNFNFANATSTSPMQFQLRQCNFNFANATSTSSMQLQLRQCNFNFVHSISISSLSSIHSRIRLNGFASSTIYLIYGIARLFLLQLQTPI
jgi:uncharacterized protein YjbI with pentapeptide repeats